MQTAAKLLAELWRRCDENHPEHVRMAIADYLGSNFMLLAKTLIDVVVDEACSSFTFWKMVITLLQDECLPVRMQMCKSLQGVIAASGQCLKYFILDHNKD